MTKLFDVVVAGGGPAGGTVAIQCAKAGMSVCLVEASDYGSPRVGETVPSAIQHALVALGLREQFEEAGHLVSTGIRAAWGSAVATTHETIRDPYGGPRHLDRARFDQMLSDAASEAGAEVLLQTQVVGASQTVDGGWEVDVGPASGAAKVQARFLVDATGRRAVVARRIGGRAAPDDHLVGAVAFFSDASTPPYALIEAVEDGWWYSAALPGGRMILAFMTDSDLWSESAASEAGGLSARVAHAAHTRERVIGLDLNQPAQLAPANSTLRANCEGPGWLAVGDAASTFDPLSGQGVYKALNQGLEAATSIVGIFDGKSDSATRYRERVAAGYRSYLVEREKYYRAMQRWPESEFWRRRR